jgi:CheY-like chemotaxis protein
MLQAHGLVVDLVDDGEQAVTAAMSGDYYAVFMDCRMPQVNGFEATRRIRDTEQQDPQHPGRRHVPIIAMTASAFDDDRQSCLDAGMDDFLPKPWTRQQLTDLLTRLATRPDAPVPTPADGVPVLRMLS